MTTLLWEFGPGTRIIVGAGAARPTARAATYLQSQVERRCGWRWEMVTGREAGPGTIVLGVPGDGSPFGPVIPAHPEEIALWCGGNPSAPTAGALAGGPSAILAAAGKLARMMDLRPGHARLPRLSRRERPAFPVRGHTLANHKQSTTYDKWSWEQWEDCLTELAAWGSNVAIVVPLHPARWRGSLPFDDPPWFDSPAREAEFARQMEIQLRLPDLCHDLGMRYGIWIPSNDVFPEEAVRHPEVSRYGRSYVCLAVPEARARLRAIRERLLAMMPRLDVLFIPSKDNGGCPGCEHCTPWAPLYRDLAQEQIAQARRYHPACQVWLSQQGLDAAESQHLLDWLDRERPDWVEAVAYGPFGEVMTFGDPDSREGVLSLERYPRGGPISGPPIRLRAALPGQYRLVLYPDETHTFRCQYPVAGMDPVVQYVWDRESAPSPRPREMARLHGMTSPAGDGSIPYSEGDTDDVNKFVWSARDWDPARSGEEITAEYARWFFGPGVGETAAALILLVEEILGAPLHGSRTIGSDIGSAVPKVGSAVNETRALVDACEARDPSLLESWRWLSLRVAALMLDYLQRVIARDRQVAAELRYRAAVWRDRPDPRAELRETIRHLERRFDETDALLAEIVWTRDRLFAIHRLAVRGVARLQHSYMKFDVLLDRWKRTLARIEAGELPTFPERYEALIAPLREAEDSVRMAVEGVPLVEHVREFAWETGATTWD
ncbi:MAG: hypothetical protein HYY04_17635 [Chloroflexi bacterium]|nr:hypothetical protein [Chloroflexota bacterium]